MLFTMRCGRTTSTRLCASCVICQSCVRERILSDRTTGAGAMSRPRSRRCHTEASATLADTGADVCGIGRSQRGRRVAGGRRFAHLITEHDGGGSARCVRRSSPHETRDHPGPRHHRSIARGKLLRWPWANTADAPIAPIVPIAGGPAARHRITQVIAQVIAHAAARSSHVPAPARRMRIIHLRPRNLRSFTSGSPRAKRRSWRFLPGATVTTRSRMS